MTARTFSNEEYSGTTVRMPIGFADRLLEVARAEFAAQLRYVDDDEEPARVLEQWLAGKQTIPMPGPRAEPGDILVKQDRGEQWMLTSRGWRELAPIELQADPGPREPWPPRPTEFQDGDPMPAPVGGGKLADPGFADKAYEDLGGAENVERPFESLGGEAGVAFKRFRRVERASDHGEHGGISGAARSSMADPDIGIDVGRLIRDAPRFFGKSVVEGCLEERDIERLWPPIKRVLDELLLHAGTLDEIAQALDGGPDGGNADPLYTAAGQAVSFARALEYARRRLLTVATDELRRARP